MATEIQEESFSSDTDFDDGGESDSSSDIDAKLAEEDVFDLEFFKCYSALKKKDEKIYDKDVKFFNEHSSSDGDSEAETTEKLLEPDYMKRSAPRMTLLDHQLAIKDDQLDELPKQEDTSVPSKSYYEKELQDIKESIAKISENVDEDSDDEFLISNSKKKIDAILDEVEDKGNEDISHLKAIWNDSEKLSKEEKFLRDYILNKRYMSNPVDTETDDKQGNYFSKNLDDLSDVESVEEDKSSTSKPTRHSEEENFDKIARIPRNSTKTIRDLVEKRNRKERRLKKLEKEKKRKKALKDADCEDIIGDMPTKFQYREVEPNDYGLSAQELLMASDEELDKWISLKAAIKERTAEEERHLRGRFEAKRHDIELKKEIFKSIYGDEGPNEKPEDKLDQPVKSEGKRKRRKSGADHPNEPEISIEGISNDVEEGKKKKRRKRGVNHKKFAKTGVAPDRLLAYGLSKNKLKKASLL